MSRIINKDITLKHSVKFLKFTNDRLIINNVSESLYETFKNICNARFDNKDCLIANLYYKNDSTLLLKFNNLYTPKYRHPFDYLVWILHIILEFMIPNSLSFNCIPTVNWDIILIDNTAVKGTFVFNNIYEFSIHSFAERGCIPEMLLMKKITHEVLSEFLDSKLSVMYVKGEVYFNRNYDILKDVYEDKKLVYRC
jgi:hypothetical protein